MASFFFLHNSQLQKGFKVTYKNINNTFKTDEEITARKREEHKEVRTEKRMLLSCQIFTEFRLCIWL